MHKPGDAWVPAACDCGHQFDIVVTGHDPHTMQFTCPSCGKVDGFTKEQADRIIAEYTDAVEAINSEIAKIARDFGKRR